MFEVSGQYEICSGCGWEDDPIQSADPTHSGGANSQCLNEARTQWHQKEKISSCVADEVQKETTANWRFEFIGCSLMGCTPLESREYDEHLEDVRSLFHDVCHFLQDSGARFVVASPQLGVWPVDAGVDLAILLEQIPDLVQFLRRNEDELFLLDFYEQGTQMRIELQKRGGILDVNCVSWGDRVHSEHSTCAVSDWLEEMVTLLTAFRQEAARVAPSVVCHPLWVAWVAAWHG